MTWRADLKAFEQTAAIKRGDRTLDPAYQDLARWVEVTYRGVRVLNFFHDPPSARIPPRLRVIFEREADVARFRLGPFRWNKAQLIRIAAAHKRLVAPRPYMQTDGLLAIPFSFEKEARKRTVWQVTEEDLSALQAAIDDPSLWLIRTSVETCVFFFHTDAQLEASKTADARERYASAYASVLDRYDEFGYFRDLPPLVAFDSEENFQTTHRGSWFAYDR